MVVHGRYGRDGPRSSSVVLFVELELVSGRCVVLGM